MKKLLAVCIATVMMLAVPACAEETDYTGDWYGDFMGAVMKLTINEDGTYAMILGEDIFDGTWEQTDEGILMDDGSLGVITEEGLEIKSEDELSMTFGRDELTGFVPADIDYEAAPDALEGKWSAYKVGTDGGYMNVAPEDISYMEMEITGTAVTLNGFFYDHETYELEEQDGGLSIFFDDESEMFQLIAVNYLTDGTARLALVTSVEDEDQIVYLFVRAEEAEAITEAATE